MDHTSGFASYGTFDIYFMLSISCITLCLINGSFLKTKYLYILRATYSVPSVNNSDSQNSIISKKKEEEPVASNEAFYKSSFKYSSFMKNLV